MLFGSRVWGFGLRDSGLRLTAPALVLGKRVWRVRSCLKPTLLILKPFLIPLQVKTTDNQNTMKATKSGFRWRVRVSLEALLHQPIDTTRPKVSLKYRP